jgi:hypothetical protein
MQTEQMQLDFFNTIHESGDELKESERKVNLQGQRILTIMQQIGKAATPAHVHAIYEIRHGGTPITSIRRSMTDMTNNGYLIKTDEMAKGRYNKPNYKWKIK